MPPAERIAEISVHYIGPSVEDGRIDLFVLSDGLRGLGRLTNRVSYLMFGSEFEHKIELDESFQSGSIVIPLHIFASAVQQGEAVLNSKGGQALSTLMTMLGFGASVGISLYKLFKKKQGRPITEDDKLDRILENLGDIERLLVIRIYNDIEVQAALRAVLRPLRTHGIIEFQTRRREIIVDSVTRADLMAADEAEVSSIVEVEEKTLDIEKAALVPHLQWHLSDEGKSFDAKIEDPKLWDRVARGERFGYGDRMRVELRTTFERDATGRLTIERIIPTVIDVEHSIPSQQLLWPDDPEA